MTLSDCPQPEWIRDLAEAQLDTQQLSLEAARALARHGLAGTAALSMKQPQAVSDAEALLLWQRQKEIRQSLAVAATAKKVNRLLGEAGIPYLLLKGPALAMQTTGDWRGRSSCDLDLLIDPADVDRVHHTLIAAGLRRRDGVEHSPGRPFRWAFPEVAYAGLPVTVDLHWGLDATPRLAALPFPALWSRAQHIQLDSQPLPTLGLEDAWLFTAIHGCRSFWFRWKWLLDSYRQWQQLDGGQRAVAAQRALSSGCDRAHWLTRALVECCEGTDAPAPDLPAWAREQARRVLAATAPGAPLPHTFRAALERRLDQMAMAPSPRAAISSVTRSVGRVLLTPRVYRSHLTTWN